MPNVLTEGSIIMCRHGGTVRPIASQNLLKVNGQRVLVQSDLMGAPITNCPIPVNPIGPTKPCTATLGTTLGISTNLKVGSQLVLLETAQGPTDGMPAMAVSWSVISAGQTKLQAR